MARTLPKCGQRVVSHFNFLGRNHEGFANAVVEKRGRPGPGRVRAVDCAHRPGGDRGGHAAGHSDSGGVQQHRGRPQPLVGERRLSNHAEGGLRPPSSRPRRHWKTRWSLKGKGVEKAMGTIRILAPNEVRSRCADFLRRLAGDQGQDLAEYGMLAALIAVVAIVAVALLGNTLATLWGNITAAFAALP